VKKTIKLKRRENKTIFLMKKKVKKRKVRVFLRVKVSHFAGKE